MKKNEDRKLAEQVFLQERGRVTNKDVADRLGVHPATVARWKRIDEWDMKLVREVTSRPDDQDDDNDVYGTDLRHLNALNDRIDTFLAKRELNPLEILQLAEAKYHVMTCMEIINDSLRFPLPDPYLSDDDLIDR